MLAVWGLVCPYLRPSSLRCFMCQWILPQPWALLLVLEQCKLVSRCLFKPRILHVIVLRSPIFLRIMLSRSNLVQISNSCSYLLAGLLLRLILYLQPLSRINLAMSAHLYSTNLLRRIIFWSEQLLSLSWKL